MSNPIVAVSNEDAPPAKLRRKWRLVAMLALKVLVSVGLLIMLARKVSFAGAAEHLTHLQWTPTFGAAGLLAASLGISACRWHLASLRMLPLSQCLRFTWMAHLYALVLPGALSADVAKGVAMAGRVQKGVGAALPASIVLDRVAGLGALLVLGLLSCLAQPELIHVSPALLIAAAGGLAVGLIALPWICRWILGWIAVLHAGGIDSQPRPWVLKLRSMADGMTHRTWLAVLSLSVCIHVVNITFYWVTLRAVGAQDAWWHMGIYTSVLNLAMLLPVSIAGVGIRDQLSVAMLPSAGGSTGVAFSWLVLAVFAVHGLLGLFLQWRTWVVRPRESGAGIPMVPSGVDP